MFLKNNVIALNFRINVISNKLNKKIKSITLSIRIVPNSLSTGILLILDKLVHLVISPALGTKRLVKYPIETAEMLFIFEVL